MSTATERPTFSQSWSRVNMLRPRLSPTVTVRRRLFHGQSWYVLHDPVNQAFFRLNPVAFHFVAMLDGRRTVEDAWRLTLEKFGDEAPTQPEVIGLLGQLNQANLLRVDLPLDAQPILERRQKRRLRYWAGQAMGIMFLQIPLVNPDRVLAWLEPLFRPVLSRLGLGLWVVWLVFCGSVFFPHLQRFAYESRQAFSPENWLWLAVVFVGVKLWHELGHGLVCKRLGGTVHEAGIMLLVLFPCPYVDTTSAWGFDSRWRRALVGAAGMMFELALAGAAALVWVHTEESHLLHMLAHRTVLLASITTILFNANVLMRFDGYFILSDLLDIPNLYERAIRHLQYVGQRWILGLRSAQPVSGDAGERAVFVAYGLAALVYRALVMLGIVLYVAGIAFAVGLVLAVWTVTSWLVVPVGRYVHWLATSPALHRRRARAVLASAAAAALVVGVVGWLPMEDRRRAVGVVEAQERAELVVQADGFVEEVQVESGDLVQAGQVILVARNPTLEARRRELEGRLEELQVLGRYAMGQSPAEQARTKAEQQAVESELAEIQRQLELLTLRSPMAGRLASTALKPLRGQFLKKGQVLGQVENLESLRITALVDQSHATLAHLQGIREVEFRTRGWTGRAHPARLIRAFDAGNRRLPHPALGTAAGGPLPNDPQDAKGQTTLRPYFQLWLEPAIPSQGTENRPVLLPGQRLTVRFTLQEKQPLLVQWQRRLQQILRDRLVL